MKNFVVLSVAMLLALARVSAQVVDVDILLESDQFLPNEPLIAKVRINNSTGQTLRLGDDPEWITFNIETMEGPYVKKLREPEVKQTFSLESSHTATVRVNLAPCFDLSQVGRYRLTATVKAPTIPTPFISRAKPFFVASGKVLRTIPFGVPPAAGEANGQPETRSYVLMQALSAQEAKLYVRVVDAHDLNIKVVPLGKLVSFSKPEPQLDKWSNLHVMFETGARSFSYSVINPEGFLLARETHEYSDSRPTMAVNDEGRIVIRGGQRRLTLDDVPPVDTALLSKDEPETPQPIVAPTNSPAATKNKNAQKASNTANGKDKKKR